MKYYLKAAVIVIALMNVLPLFAEPIALKILSVSPSGSTRSIEQTKRITITFNGPVIPLGKIKENFTVPEFSISPSVAGKFQWEGTSTLTFTPDTTLPYATAFRVKFAGDFTNEVTGEKLGSDYVWEFETPRPELRYSYPYEASKWINLDAKVYLQFNQPMDSRNAVKFIQLLETNQQGASSEIPVHVRAKVDREFDREQPVRVIKEDGNDYPVYDNEYHRRYQIAHSTNSYVLVVSPLRSLKKDCSYAVKLWPGLPAEQGTLPFKDAKGINFSTYHTFSFVRDASWDSLTPNNLKITFTNPVLVSDIVKHLRITPEIDLSHYKKTHYFTSPDTTQDTCSAYIYAQLKPRTTYSLAISGELQDKFGQTLGPDVTTSFTTTDFPAHFSMPAGMGIVESYVSPLAHPLTLVNVNSLNVRMTSLVREQIVPATLKIEGWQGEGHPVFNPVFEVDKKWDVAIEANKKMITPLYFNEVLKQKHGIVYLSVDAPQLKNYSAKTALLQVTAMGLTAKFSSYNSLVHVSYLKDSSPVREAKIEVRDEYNKILWTGVTDEKGDAVIGGWKELNIEGRRWQRPRLWVIVTKAEDTAFITSQWGTGIYPYYFNIPYEWYPRFPDYQAHIFTERGIYRPGETVHIKGLVRQRNLNTWEIPANKRYRMEIRDSRQGKSEQEITLSEYGAFSFDLNLPKNAPTGYYSIVMTEKKEKKEQPAASPGEENETDNYNVEQMSASFRVEEYKPATFEVNVGFDQKEYVVNDTATITMSGRYLFGAAMTDASIKHTVTLQKKGYENEEYDGFNFSESNWDYYYEDNRSYQSSNIVAGEGTLDKESNFTVTVPTLKPGGGDYFLRASASVTSPDRQTIWGGNSAIVHGSLYYLGLKPSSTFIEKGRKIKTQIITPTLDGTLMAGNEIECRLVRREWNSVRRVGVNGRLEWHTENKDMELKKEVVVTKKEPIVWQWEADKSGYYVFIASGKDIHGTVISSSFSFYVTGEDYCAWERGEDDRIELVSDKQRYKAGEIAKIMVKSPYEKAKALVTLEREGIIKHWFTEVKGSADTISIPITPDLLPNIYVSVILYRGREKAGPLSINDDDDLGKPAFKIGYKQLLVDPQRKHLSVSVKTDKKVYRPGEKVKVKLKTSDESKQGVAAEITVAVVDVGILNLINYTTPDSFPYFYGPLALSVETSETRLHMIGLRNYGEKGENRGGGGGLSQGFDVRTKIIPTAYWNPAVSTDSQGNAEVSFELPDNLTTFRIMATAYTRDSKFGASDTRIEVNKPLVLKPSMPRLARVGDSFKAGVLCHNNTAKKGKVKINLSLKGLRLMSMPDQEIELEKGEAKEVLFDLRADSATATAEFVFKAVMGDENDGLRWTIPVEAERTTETVATYGSTLQQALENVVIPANIYEDSSFIKTALASTALVGIGGGLEYLFTYPYGCLEQRTSKIMPVILASDFILEFGLAENRKHEPAELINAYLSLLPDYQSYGGFSIWPTNNPSPYMTCYALWAALTAEKQGYTLSPEIKNKALDYLSQYVRGQSKGWQWPYHVNAKLTTDAFALYVLALGGRNEQSLITTLYEKLPQLPLFGRIYLLKALYLSNMSQHMRDKVEESITNSIKIESTQAHFEEPDESGMDWIWSSNVRTTAAIVQGLLEVKGQYPLAEKIIRWLMANRSHGRWENTQDNLYVFYAFNEYVKAYEKEGPAFTATVLLDNKEIVRELFVGRQTNHKESVIPVTGLPKEKKLPLTLKKEGTGRLYYLLRLTYAPQEIMPALNRGFSVQRKITSMDGSAHEKKTYVLGKRYKVTLTVKTEHERHFVVLNDPVPAGFEVVDLSLATEGAPTPVDTGARYKGEYDGEEYYDDCYDYYSWGTFNHWENYDDRVLVFADYLNKGEHTYSYIIQATMPGEYEAPAAFAEEMYNPELFGRTAPGRITIRENMADQNNLKEGE